VTAILPSPGPSSSLLDEPVALPRARGPLSEHLLHHLVRGAHDLGHLPRPVDDPIHGEDSALALYLIYELHYQGLPDVDEAWEWEPSLLRERRRLEARLEDAVTDLVGPPPLGMTTRTVLDELRTLAGPGDSPSLSERVAKRGTITEIRELAVHRSAYQLKEADPHTWGIPRLTGGAKAAMVVIQCDEYAGGEVDGMHSRLFADTMVELNLDPRYGAHLDAIPGVTLSTCNLVSMFGLHRRWRGALVGHLALFEMCSVTPMSNYAAALRRLGFGPSATRFYDEHVVADARHSEIALDRMVRSLADDEPILRGEVIFGAKALAAVEAAFARHVLDAWAGGRSSLRAPAW